MQDGSLLHQYVRHGSQAAFGEIVKRHLTLVYGVCLREVGDPQMAEDVTQAVFLVMARKAASLERHPALSGWLFRTARLAFRDALRQERRRRRREHEAAQSISPPSPPHGLPLNEALASLKPDDREAVLLRFFEGMSFQEAGEVLDISADAAQKRVTRAIAKMRAFLAHNGTVLPAAAIVAALSAEATKAVPAQGAAPLFLSSTGARAIQISQGVLRKMWLTKATVAGVTVGLVAAGMGVLHTSAAIARKHTADAKSGHAARPTPALRPPSQAVRSRLARQLADMRLRGGFTLVYRVTVQDVRTPAILAMQGNQTLHPVEQFSVTLSGRDSKLLYLGTWGFPNQKENMTTAVVLDGDREYEATGKNIGMINADGPRDGTAYRCENIDRLRYCPIPGVGLPGMDLVQSPVCTGVAPDGHARFSGRVPRINLIGEEPYQPGETAAAVTQGRLKVLSLRVGSPAAPDQAWSITQSRLFEGHWIGERLRETQYYQVPLAGAGSGNNPVPGFIADFALQEARSAPMEATSFDISTYLVKGANVLDTADGLSFTFDPEAGDLKRQAAQASVARRRVQTTKTAPTG